MDMSEISSMDTWVLSHGPLFVTPWTAAHQVPLSMEFSKQKYWNGLPFPSPRRQNRGSIGKSNDDDPEKLTDDTGHRAIRTDGNDGFEIMLRVRGS